MKKIKYISAVILICLGLVLTGEIYVRQVSTAFRDFYIYTTFLFGDDMQSATDEIKFVAQQNNIIAFTVEIFYTTDITQNLVIYSTRELPAEVIEHLGKGKDLKSLLGKVYVTFDSIDNVPSHTLGVLFIYGNQDDAFSFIDTLSKIYPRNTFVEEPSGFSIPLIILTGYWVVTILYILFLTLVDTFYQKKEVLVSVLQGMSITGLYLRNIILDFLVYVAIFTSGCIVISMFTSALYSPIFIIYVFGTLYIGSALIYLLLYKLDYKLITSNSKMPKRVLKVSYIIKAVTVFYAVIAIASGILFIPQIVKYTKTSEFFKTHKQYSYGNFQYIVNYNTGDIEDLYIQVRQNADMIDKLYTEYFDVCKPIVLYNAYNPAENNSDVEGIIYDFGIIVANYYAYDYIASVIDGFSSVEHFFDNVGVNKYNDFEISDLSNDMFPNNIYIIVPNSMNEAEKQRAIEAAMLYGGIIDDDNYSIYYYDNDAEVICIRGGVTEAISIGAGWSVSSSENDKFALVRNPVIVLDVTHPTNSKYLNMASYNGAVMYDFDGEPLDSINSGSTLIEEIITRYSLEGEIVQVTNILDSFNHSWHLLRAAIISALIIGTLSLLLAIITIFRIINLEYTINAVELCVKKILGWGIVRKNIGIISGILIFNILCSVIAGYIILKLLTMSITIIVAIIIGVFSIDIFAVFWSASRIERAQMTKILKGGAL